MSDINRLTPRILTAIDFSLPSERAFLHALSLAVAQKARLTMLHIGPESRKEVPWEQYPGVQETLIRWGMLDADSPKTDVGDKLSVGIKKMAMRDDDPYNGMVDYLRKRPTDLLVMTTEARRGFSRLSHSSVAEGVAYTSHCHALLLPVDAHSFIDTDSGIRNIKKVIFVYDHEPDPRLAFTWLNEWLPVFSDTPIEVHALYIGNEEDEPEIALPKHPGLEWRRITREGKALKVILDYADEIDADLLSIMNQRSKGFIGRLRGSLGEQLLRQSHRPLLLMPMLK